MNPLSYDNFHGIDVLGRCTAPEHTELLAYARVLQARIAFAWPAMDGFYEEDERIVGHAADSYHRIDIRQTDNSDQGVFFDPHLWPVLCR
jgi:hypothetical protein